MNHKKLPIGIDSFEKIRTNDFYYVDKTMFIADLLHNWGEVNLFTRPRRFGKSLNINMLKCFFEIGCDKTLFNGLRISREKELCEEYMGRFPVISISLKDVSGSNYSLAGAALRNIAGREAMRFQFLLESSRLSQEEKNAYRRLIKIGSGSQAIYDLTDTVLTDSLKLLSHLLAKHYGKKVILLIDEYDVPLDQAYQSGYYTEMVSLLRRLFSSALKTNEDLLFAVLTGCLRISKESIFTGLNNLKVHTITDARYDEYFGFTDTDVDGMLAFYGLTSYRNLIREWYDGYLFGKIGVYCPWDVLNYCDVLLADKDAEPENYWANTSGNSIVRRLLQKADQTTRNEIEQLVNGGSIVKTIREELTYRDIESSIENIWSVLYSTGYLAQKERLPGKQMRLVLPNREVKELFIVLVKDWFQGVVRADSSRINRFCAAFPSGSVSLIQEMLHDYLWDSISVRDTAVRIGMKENFYHGMVLGLLQSQENWLVQSNAEMGKGYSDISVCTPERIGILIELKYADDGRLERACAEALKQIEEQKYAEGLQRHGMMKIIKYGIAFCGKECLAAMAQDPT